VRLIDNAVYVKGTAPPIRAVCRKPTRCCGTATGWPGSGCTGPTWRRSGRWPPSSSCTSCRCRTRLRRISGPELERYGPTLFAVLLPARYLDDVERMGCGELHLFVGVNFVITIPGRSSSSSGPPTRCRTCWAALERGFDKYRGDVELRRDLRDVDDHVARVVERGMRSGSCCRTR
jgi:hypothetical protein